MESVPLLVSEFKTWAIEEEERYLEEYHFLSVDCNSLEDLCQSSSETSVKTEIEEQKLFLQNCFIYLQIPYKTWEWLIFNGTEDNRHDFH
jgi:hypothetical protein